jgi:acetylornithine deacetylase/succinyl-diaminopimelate desuccinylase-like protein
MNSCRELLERMIGPGDIAQAHTRDEWITLSQLELAARVYLERPT